MSVAKTRKVRRICGHRGGGPNNLDGKRRAPKTFRAKNVKKHMRALQKQRMAAERARIIEQRRHSAIVGQNVEGLLANATNGENAYKKLTEDPEYLDQIFASFCKFLDDLRELEAQAEQDGDDELLSSIGIQKLQIAEILLNNFGKKKNVVANANVNANQVVNNFGANLANILSGIKL